MQKHEKALAILQDRQPEWQCDNCGAQLFNDELALKRFYGNSWGTDACPHCQSMCLSPINQFNG